MLGFSCLHGPHQLAQKSTSTYLPLKDDSETSLPLASGIVRSGAGLPTHEDCSDCWGVCMSLPVSWFFRYCKLASVGNLAIVLLSNESYSSFESVLDAIPKVKAATVGLSLLFTNSEIYLFSAT